MRRSASSSRRSSAQRDETPCPSGWAAGASANLPKASRTSPQGSARTVVAGASAAMDVLDYAAAYGAVWDLIRATNSYIEDQEPWKLHKAGEAAAVEPANPAIPARASGLTTPSTPSTIAK